MFFLLGILASFHRDSTIIQLYFVDGGRELKGIERLEDLRTLAGHGDELQGIGNSGSLGGASCLDSKRSKIDYIHGSILTIGGIVKVHEDNLCKISN